ncbi:MAG TPA: hypothetical protein PK765_04875 [bacterium]|nr:hypothetical protein [bacterium]
MIGSIEIYTTGRKNSLLTALTSQFLERSIASGVFENHAEAITGLLGETPDLSRVSRTLADLRERGKIDQRTEQVLSLKITSASERLVNNAGLSRLQDFLLNTAAFGIRQIDECFPSDAPPLVVG